MNLLADESVDRPIVERLRADGHTVEAVAEDSPGLPDADVLARAVRDGVVLVTGDKDFGELVYRRRRPHAGVLLLRLDGLDEAGKCEVVAQAVVTHGHELPGAFAVLTADSLRIRRP